MAGDLPAGHCVAMVTLAAAVCRWGYFPVGRTTPYPLGFFFSLGYSRAWANVPLACVRLLSSKPHPWVRVWATPPCR